MESLWETSASTACPNACASQDQPWQAGQVDDGPDTQTFSMDFRAPLSPLIAFAACLAAQDWA